jgi:L-seryl-tRNA(Ser) seleniumtransferase
MSDPSHELLRAMPSTSTLLETETFRGLASEFGDRLAKLELRALLAQARSSIGAGKLAQPPAAEELLADLRPRLVRLVRPEGREAINATGILLHTGLGRAPLCAEALAAIAHLRGYSLLQSDVADGGRSLREEKVEQLLCELTGCEAATVVNNNAAATMLILNTLAAGREVIISRGQLIEIGGSFRIPDVMTQSGAVLREVGTTNRTHVADYVGAIGERTAAILHVHTSNYRIRGFAGVPSIEELVQVGRDHGVPVVDDVGSGALVPLQPYGLPDEPLVHDSIAAGSDVCCFSADKLIGGPQAGLIVGKQALIGRIRKNPFARMFRVCKLTLAALEATLCHFVDGRSYRHAIPFYSMLGRPIEALQQQAKLVVSLIGEVPGATIAVVDHLSYVGSGSVPDQGVATVAVSIRHEARTPRELARRLRTSIPAVFGHIKDDRLLLDMRTVESERVRVLAALARQALFA